MKLDIQLFAASKSTSFSESNISIENNTSSLTINIWFSANNSTTWFQTATLYCTCDGYTQSQNVSHSKGGSSSASFTFNNIVHNPDGSKTVSWSWSCATGTSVLGTIGDSGNQPLTKINRYPILKSGSNFTDEGNPNFNIITYNTYPIRVKLEVGTNYQLITRDIPSNTTNYTLNLTETERNLLRSLSPNSNNLKVRETVCAMNGNQELSVSYKDYTMTIVNGNPVFNNFEAQDVNGTTVALTDDSSVNINGYSNIKATISAVNKAVAKKEATMVKYRFVIGDKTIDINYDDEESVSGIIYNAPNGIYNVYAIDSRGNSTLVTKLASSEIAYQNISLDPSNCSIERNDNNSGDIAILKFTGKFWKQSFGVGQNIIQNVTYQFKKTTDTQWKIGTTYITPTINNDGTFEFEGQIASDNQDTTWDLQSAYDVKISISDYLSTAQLQLTPLTSATPHLCYADDGVAIMGDYDENIGGLLQVGGKKVTLPIFDVLWAGDLTLSSSFQTITTTNKITDYDLLLVYRNDLEVATCFPTNLINVVNNRYSYSTTEAFISSAFQIQDANTLNPKVGGTKGILSYANNGVTWYEYSGTYGKLAKLVGIKFKTL